MAANLLNEKDWQKLLRNINRGTCILMLGADIPSDPNNASQSSLTSLFAHHLAEQISSDELLNANDLLHVAQSYVANRVGLREDLELEAESFFRGFQNQTTQLHQCLAQLPFSYCISITPEDFMHNAFIEAGKTPQEAFYHFRSNLPLSVTADEHSPLVYKLYGAISDSRSLVLTETDLLDFLANIIAGSPELPPDLSKLFNEKETSFLFIGFGFQHWYLRVLLHLFRNQLNNIPPWSMALEDNRFFADPDHIQTAMFYDFTHSIEFKHCSWTEFAIELLKRYQDRKPASQKPVEKALPADAPMVFLCHCSKDSETVGRFAEKLREQGLNTWRDRDNLRGGENWDRRIRHLIENRQIDYFLVLQTPNMLAETQSYFIQEIKCALVRQEKNWSDYLFIIPLFLAGNNDQKLKDLSHLNYLDLRDDKDLARLVNDIKDDRQKRLARKESINAN